jgi:MFS family permease
MPFATMNPTQSQPVNWKQLSSLAYLNASVVISWIAYHNYQPKVLEKFQVADWQLFLLIAQSIILVAIPPLAGLIGDYMIKKSGNRFVVFTVGIGITAMVFMAVAFSLQGNPLLSIKYLIPFFMVVWLISMNIFHSPANSMLELFAPSSQLPFAMAILAMTSELISALEPIIVTLVDVLGASFTFAFGGFLIVSSGYLFLQSTRNIQAFKEERSEGAEGVKSSFPLIIGIGTSVGLIVAILLNLLPALLSHKLATFDSVLFGGKHFSSLILGLAAVLALPLSKMADRFGISKTFVIGLFLSLVSILFIYLFDNQWFIMAAMIVLSIGFSMCSVSAFPLVLQRLSARQVTFGTGLFFGFNELADGLMNIFMS